MNIKVHYTARPDWNKEAQVLEIGEMDFANHRAAAEHAYMALNAVEANPQVGAPGYLLESTGANRSMCSNDIVEIDGSFYVCCICGFEKITDIPSYLKWLKKENPFCVGNEELKKFNKEVV